jgi:hypothetical protein
MPGYDGVANDYFLTDLSRAVSAGVTRISVDSGRSSANSVRMI